MWNGRSSCVRTRFELVVAELIVQVSCSFHGRGPGEVHLHVEAMREPLLHLHLERVVPGPADGKLLPRNAGELWEGPDQIAARRGRAIQCQPRQKSREGVGHVLAEIRSPQGELLRGEIVDILTHAESAGLAAYVRNIQ